jgi:hypothetical protein
MAETTVRANVGDSKALRVDLADEASVKTLMDETFGI